MEELGAIDSVDEEGDSSSSFSESETSDVGGNEEATILNFVNMIQASVNVSEPDLLIDDIKSQVECFFKRISPLSREVSLRKLLDQLKGYSENAFFKDIQYSSVDVFLEAYKSIELFGKSNETETIKLFCNANCMKIIFKFLLPAKRNKELVMKVVSKFVGKKELIIFPLLLL